MDRKFLEGLNLESDVVEKIMAEHGKSTQSNKQDLEALKTENETLKTQQATLQTQLDEANNTLTAANAEIESYKGMDIDGIKLAADDWKTKYEQAQEESKTKIAEIEQQHAYDKAVSEHMSGLEFASAAAKRGYEADFRAKGLPLDKGRFLGAEDYVKQYRESDPTAFKSDAPPPPVVTTDLKNEPGGGKAGGFNFNFTPVRAVKNKGE